MAGPNRSGIDAESLKKFDAALTAKVASAAGGREPSVVVGFTASYA